MNAFNFFLFFFSIMFIGCTSEMSLKEVSKEEVIKRLRARTYNQSGVLYISPNRDTLTTAGRELLNTGKASKRFFEDENGLIKNIEISKLKESDIFFEIMYREFQDHPLNYLGEIEIECNELEKIRRAYQTDQSSRKKGFTGQGDKENREILFSFVNKCGWEPLLPNMDSIWFIYQHSGEKLMAYYFTDIQEMYENGYLSSRSMALSIDRIRMNAGYPQVYGSQIVVQSFYDIQDEVNVNKRRKSMGMKSIQQRARDAGFDYVGPAIETENN